LFQLNWKKKRREKRPFLALPGVSSFYWEKEKKAVAGQSEGGKKHGFADKKN